MKQSMYADVMEVCTYLGSALCVTAVTLTILKFL